MDNRKTCVINNTANGGGTATPQLRVESQEHIKQLGESREPCARATASEAFDVVPTMKLGVGESVSDFNQTGSAQSGRSSIDAALGGAEDAPRVRKRIHFRHNLRWRRELRQLAGRYLDQDLFRRPTKIKELSLVEQSLKEAREMNRKLRAETGK